MEASRTRAVEMHVLNANQSRLVASARLAGHLILSQVLQIGRRQKDSGNVDAIADPSPHWF